MMYCSAEQYTIDNKVLNKPLFVLHMHICEGSQALLTGLAV